MKITFALIAAAATLVMAEQPKFLNSNFDVVAGEPFTLKFSGCENGCDIILQNGDPDNLKDVQTLKTGVTGSEITFTLSPSFPKDVYAFKIVTEGEPPNYSEQFTFNGADVTTTQETSTPIPTPTEQPTTQETTTQETTTSAETSTQESSTLVTVSSSSAESTPNPTTSGASTTGSGAPQKTDVPDAAVRLGASNIALLAGVAAVAGYFL